MYILVLLVKYGAVAAEVDNLLDSSCLLKGSSINRLWQIKGLGGCNVSGKHITRLKLGYGFAWIT